MLSDAHGNAYGLRLMLDRFDALGVEYVVYLGDAVGYMPDWKEVFEILDSRVNSSVMGNHEAMISGLLPIHREKEEVYRLFEQKNLMSREELHRLAALPTELVVDTEAGKVRFVHGSMSDPLEGRVFLATPVEVGELKGYAAVFCANTHRPFVRLVGDSFLVNVGSCGLPRDIGNLAAGSVWDVGLNPPRIVRVRLDVAKTKERFDGRTHPDVLKVFDRTDKKHGQTNES